MIAPLRCAILSFAHVHAESYATALVQSPETELVAVWDNDAARGRQAAAHQGVPSFQHLDQLLGQTDLDAVIITAENVHHRALCEAACRMGKHVLCEKPLATTAVDAEAMIRAASQAGVVLATAFPMRHNAPARRVKQQLQDGVLGEIYTVQATNHGKLPPGWFLDPALSGGGAIFNHTVHVLDLLRWYLEDEPVEVYAESSHGFHSLAVEDAALLTISFQSGVVATLDPSWSRPSSFPTWGDVTMEIAGQKGTLRLDAFAQKVVFYPQSNQHMQWLDWSGSADAGMIADFAHAVRTGQRPAADGRDGERAMAVALAAYKSVQLGQPAPIPPPMS